MNQKYNIGFLGALGKLVIDDTFLGYTHPYGRQFRVALRDISTVTVDVIGRGMARLRVIGNGTDLASAEMPATQANKCQAWILNHIPHA